MERFTKKDGQGHYHVEETDIEKTGQGYCGPAIQRLAQVENLMEFLIKRQQQLSLELDAMKIEGKTRSARFRDKMAQKLTNGQILSALLSAISQKESIAEEDQTGKAKSGPLG